MPQGRRLFILALLLVVAGVTSYFFAESTTYDEKATYVLSRAKDGNWQRHEISGNDLNQQAKAAKPMNQIMSVILIGGGLAIIGVQWRLSRR